MACEDTGHFFDRPTTDPSLACVGGWPIFLQPFDAYRIGRDVYVLSMRTQNDSILVSWRLEYESVIQA